MAESIRSTFFPDEGKESNMCYGFCMLRKWFDYAYVDVWKFYETNYSEVQFHHYTLFSQRFINFINIILAPR